MKNRKDERMSALTGLAAHCDSNLHTGQGRAIICRERWREEEREREREREVERVKDRGSKEGEQK